MVAERAQQGKVVETVLMPPPQFRLILSPRPDADVTLYGTIQAVQNAGVKVEKYATRFGHGWEKHTDSRGIVTWWKLIAPGFRWEWQSMSWKPIHEAKKT